MANLSHKVKILMQAIYQNKPIISCTEIYLVSSTHLHPNDAMLGLISGQNYLIEWI